MRFTTGCVVGCVVALGLTTLSGCGMPEHSGAPAALAAFEPTSSIGEVPPQPNVERLSASAIAVETPSATLTAPSMSVPLEVVGGTFLGIGKGSFLADALSVLGVAVVAEHADQLVGQSRAAVDFAPCSASATDHWVMHADGLTLLFEGGSADTARLTKWQYTGGPAIGFTELVAPKGVKIGGTRRDVMSAYKKVEEVGAAIRVSEPAQLQFVMRGDSIVSFGSTRC
ncbi:MAG: hypothetical protein QOE00_2137 [Ilumatobacteraceae bacterium]